MSELFDLDALERDESREPFHFRFDGETYTLPPTLDLRAAALLQAGELNECLRALLGPEQWRHLLDAQATFGFEHLNALLDAYAEHLGMELGNSPASLDSSLPIRRPSRRTSAGSTRPTSAA